MSGRAREHLRSNIVGYVALFIALAGTAYALPGKNTVDSGDIRNNQVSSADLKDNFVLGKDIRTGGVGTTDVGDNSLTGIDIAPDSLSGADIGPLTGGDVAEDSLTGDDISESSLLGLDATTLAGRQVCSYNERLTGNNSTLNLVTDPICTVGPFQLTANCESAGGGDALSAYITVETTASDTATAGDVTDGDLDPAETGEIQRLNDFTATNTPVVETVPFSIWVAGGAHMSGIAGVRANSLNVGSGGGRLCDFAVFATGSPG